LSPAWASNSSSAVKPSTDSGILRLPTNWPCVVRQGAGCFGVDRPRVPDLYRLYDAISALDWVLPRGGVVGCHLVLSDCLRRKCRGLG
jgi:hypothetical protein